MSLRDADWKRFKKEEKEKKRSSDAGEDGQSGRADENGQPKLRHRRARVLLPYIELPEAIRLKSTCRTLCNWCTTNGVFPRLALSKVFAEDSLPGPSRWRKGPGRIMVMVMCHVHRTRMLVCMHKWGSSLHLSPHRRSSIIVIGARACTRTSRRPPVLPSGRLQTATCPH